MTLLYSETLYSIYLNYGKVIQVFYTIVFIWAIYNYQVFQGVWKWFFAYIFLSFLAEVAFHFTPINEMKNNHFVDHFYLLFGATFLGIFLFNSFDKLLLRRITLISTILFNISVIIGFFYNDGYLLPPKAATPLHIVFLILHLILQRNLITENKSKELSKNPLYWWNISFVIMHIIYLLFSITIGYILAISDDLAFIWYIIKNTFDPVSCILWIIAINKLRTWKFKPTASQSLSQ